MASTKRSRRVPHGGLLTVALLLLALVAACSPTAEEEATPGAPATDEPTADAPTDAGEPEETSPPAEGDEEATVVVAVPEEIVTLDPHLREAFFLRGIMNYNIYEPLVGRTDDGELEPLLAEDMPEQVDESTWRVTVRSGVTFANGEPFDAEAAAYSISRIIDPEYESELAPRISTITSVEAVDESTIEVVTDGLDPILPARLELIMMVPPVHAESEDFAREPSGTGPYQWVSGFGEGPVTLEINPDYWGGPPSGNITGVEFRVIPDESTRIAAVQAGEVDLILRMPPDSAPVVPQPLSVPGNENVIVVLNTTAGITEDVRVREALNLAIDKEAMAADLWEGYADPMPCQAVAPASLGFNDDLEAPAYDPDRARELLEEAGAAGETLTFVTAGDVFALGREMGEVVASYWRAVGLEVDLRFEEFDPYLDALYAKGEERPDAIYLSTSTEFLDADAGVQRVYISDAALGGYANAQVDELARAALATADPDERAAVYADLLAIGCEEFFVGFLLHPQDVYGASDRLRFEPRVDERLPFMDMSVDS